MKICGLTEFLKAYPGMSLQPARNDEVKIHGQFHYNAKGFGKEIEDSFELELVVNRKYPSIIPEVRETAGKIPKQGRFRHVRCNHVSKCSRYLVFLRLRYSHKYVPVDRLNIPGMGIHLPKLGRNSENHGFWGYI